MGREIRATRFRCRRPDRDQPRQRSGSQDQSHAQIATFVGQLASFIGIRPPLLSSYDPSHASLLRMFPLHRSSRPAQESDGTRFFLARGWLLPVPPLQIPLPRISLAHLVKSQKAVISCELSRNKADRNARKVSGLPH